MSSLLANLAPFVKTIIPYSFIFNKMQNYSSQIFDARDIFILSDFLVMENAVCTSLVKRPRGVTGMCGVRQ